MYNISNFCWLFHYLAATNWWLNSPSSILSWICTPLIILPCIAVQILQTKLYLCPLQSRLIRLLAKIASQIQNFVLWFLKPISFTRFLSRCQVDLIDFRDMSEEHYRSECGVPFEWLLVYQDHFTKYVMLRLLKHKSTDEELKFWTPSSVNLAHPTSSNPTTARILQWYPVLSYQWKMAFNQNCSC